MNKTVGTIRSLVIDIINNANSGHPGMAIGSASFLYQIFNYNINTTPLNSGWINRDRFVLASGHASALLYSLLHLSGFNISIDDLKRFCQWNSVTPGHPEYKVTHGVDASSGPLGQGVPTAIGMALAEKRIFIEMGNGGLTYKYTGLNGKIIDVNSFGQTAPPGISMREYGFTSDRIVEETERMFS